MVASVLKLVCVRFHHRPFGRRVTDGTRDFMGDNGGVKLRQIPEVTIHCAVCLNQGRDVAATTVIKGYAACEDHTALVSKPGFDLFELFGRNPL